MPAVKERAVAVRHLDGCPEDRTEDYPVQAPGGEIQVVRCVDCGAQTTTTTTNPREA